MPRISLTLLAVIAVGCSETRYRGVNVEKDLLADCRGGHGPSCRTLANQYRQAGEPRVAWAFVEEACGSTADVCGTTWRENLETAPTLTDALELLHRSCSDKPSACRELADWHAARGRVARAEYHRSRSAGAKAENDVRKMDDENFELWKLQKKAESDQWKLCHIHGVCGGAPSAEQREAADRENAQRTAERDARDAQREEERRAEEERSERERQEREAKRAEELAMFAWTPVTCTHMCCPQHRARDTCQEKHGTCVYTDRIQKLYLRMLERVKREGGALAACAPELED